MTKSYLRKFPGPRIGPVPIQKTLYLKVGKKRIRGNEDTIRTLQKVLGGEITEALPN